MFLPRYEHKANLVDGPGPDDGMNDDLCTGSKLLAIHLQMPKLLSEQARAWKNNGLECRNSG